MIRILFFAGLKEKLNTSEIEWTVCPLTVSDLRKQLNKVYESKVDFNPIMVAINEEYAEDDAMIQCGSVVAFIPPVSGG